MDLKRLSETSPIIGAFLIFIGYIRMDLYYSHWNIHIYNYLDFSEIMLSFLNDSNTLLFFCLILLLQMTIGMGTITMIKNWRSKINETNTEAKDEAIKAIENKPNLTETYDNKPKITSIILFVMFLIPFFSFLYFHNLLSLYFSSIFLIQFLLLFFEKIVKLNSLKDCGQISIVLTLLGFAWGLSEYNIKKTENNPIMVEINTENELISTNNELLFIGKTSNYYILYDKHQRKSVIIKDIDVKKTLTNSSY